MIGEKRFESVFVTSVDEDGREIIKTEAKQKSYTTVHKLNPQDIKLTYYPDAKYIDIADAVEITQRSGIDNMPSVLAVTENGDSRKVLEYHVINGITEVLAAQKLNLGDIPVKVYFSHIVEKCGNPLMIDEMVIRDLKTAKIHTQAVTEAIARWMVKVAGLQALPEKEALEILNTLEYKDSKLQPSQQRALREGLRRLGQRSIKSFMKNGFKFVLNIDEKTKENIKAGKTSHRELTRKKDSTRPQIHEAFKAVIKLTRAVGKKFTSIPKEVQKRIDALNRELDAIIQLSDQMKSA